MILLVSRPYCVELLMKEFKWALVYTEIYNNPLSGVYFMKTRIILSSFMKHYA
jgi:hypothetical protein